ncbi:hypothetical protein ACVIGB_000680 [Bradyrhizobium sp. USDA 4341]
MASDKKSKNVPDEDAFERAYGTALNSGDVEELERLNVVARERRSRPRPAKSRE